MNRVNELKIASVITSHKASVAWVFDKSPMYNSYRYYSSRSVWVVKYIDVDYIIVDWNSIILNYE